MASSKNNSSISEDWFLTEKSRLRIMAFTFPSAIVLGIYGYLHYPMGEGHVDFFNALYHTAQLFIMHSPHFGPPVPLSLEAARWLAAASTALVLINTVLHLFHNERMEYVLRKRSNHAIVCGLGRRGIAVAEKLHQSGQKVVAVDKNPEPEIMQRLLHLGIPLVIGDATRPDILRQARIEYAAKLYTLCPEDTTNLSIALAAQRLKKTINPKSQYFIHINDAEVRSALQTNHQENSSETGQTFHFIDAYGPEAIRLLAHDLPLDHDGITPNDSRQVHLIILGFGCMGRTIAVKAAQLGQFANRKRMRISVIDRNAFVNQSALLFHHPFITDTADFLFYQQEVLSPETRNLIEKWCDEPGMLVNLVICFDNLSIAYDTVFNLLPLFKKENVRVAVRINEAKSFNFLLIGAGASEKNGFHIRPFGIEKEFENLIDPDKDEVEKFAVDIHAAYSALIKYELKNDKIALEKREKSGELNPWETLNEDFRESNRQQAVHIYFKIRACGFEIVEANDPRPAINVFEAAIFNTLAIMEHDRWVAERKVNNWKFGKESVKEQRINKNLVDWNLLTDEVKGYDENTVAMIPKLLEKVGKKMVLASNEK